MSRWPQRSYQRPSFCLSSASASRILLPTAESWCCRASHVARCAPRLSVTVHNVARAFRHSRLSGRSQLHGMCGVSTATTKIMCGFSYFAPKPCGTLNIATALSGVAYSHRGCGCAGHMRRPTVNALYPVNERGDAWIDRGLLGRHLRMHTSSARCTADAVHNAVCSTLAAWELVPFWVCRV